MANTMSEFVKEQEVQEPPKPEIQEQPKPTEGQEVVNESTVVIDGKPRPLKNYEAELKRKFEKEKEEELERVRADYEYKYSQSHPQTPVQQPNWMDQVYQMAENEIATTGKAVPLQTIMQVANSISQRNLDTVFKTEKQSQKAVNSFKRSIKSEPDFKEIEDEFDELVDQLKPDQINSPTLEVILNSVRGKRSKDLYAKARIKAKEDIEKESQILGSPVEQTSSGKPPSTSLSSDQKLELDSMNKETNMEWTVDEYKKALQKKQDRFKLSGAKNTPQLLNDLMIK